MFKPNFDSQLHNLYLIRFIHTTLLIKKINVYFVGGIPLSLIPHQQW